LQRNIFRRKTEFQNHAYTQATGRSCYREHVRDMHKTFLQSEPPVINSLPRDSSSPVSPRKSSLKRRQVDVDLTIETSCDETPRPKRNRTEHHQEHPESVGPPLNCMPPTSPSRPSALHDSLRSLLDQEPQVGRKLPIALSPAIEYRLDSEIRDILQVEMSNLRREVRNMGDAINARLDVMAGRLDILQPQATVGRDICQNFNASGGCTWDRCTREHICNICLSPDHPATRHGT
jgi:hypothetical protein